MGYVAVQLLPFLMLAFLMGVVTGWYSQDA